MRLVHDDEGIDPERDRMKDACCGGWSRRLVWGAFVALLVLHHDWWYWNDATLVAGFLPIGLAYHVGFSIAAALLWAAASRWAWPLEEHDRAADAQAASAAQESGHA